MNNYYKINRINLILILFIASVTIYGCDPNFLERNPLDQLSGEVFWNDRQDIEAALTALYGSMQNDPLSFGRFNFDLLTDNGFGQHNYWNTQSIVQGNIDPTVSGYIPTIYNVSYSIIARANIFIEQIQNYDNEDIGELEKLRFEAEARLVRALNYFELYYLYGEVPLVTSPLSIDDQAQPKSSKDEVMSQIINDLNFGIEYLTDAPYYSANGRITVSAAKGIKARVLMYDAYGQGSDTNIDVLNEVRELTSSIINSGHYELSDIYEDVFKANTQENNPEILFSIKYLAPNNYHPLDQWLGDWLVASPLQNLIDIYEPLDSNNEDYEYHISNNYYPFEDLDRRLSETIFYQRVVFGENVHNPSNNAPTGYGVKKFLNPDTMPYGYETQSDQDWVLLRYADILLMYAESENELSGPTSAVYDAINQLRERAGISLLSPGLTESQMREMIRKERRIELAFEGLRFYDLKRWGIAEEVLNNVTDGLIDYNFEPRFYQWPLPQNEIDRSNGVLIQNPDY